MFRNVHAFSRGQLHMHFPPADPACVRGALFVGVQQVLDRRYAALQRYDEPLHRANPGHGGSFGGQLCKVLLCSCADPRPSVVW